MEGGFVFVKYKKIKRGKEIMHRNQTTKRKKGFSQAVLSYLTLNRGECFPLKYARTFQSLIYKIKRGATIHSKGGRHGITHLWGRKIINI